MKELVGVSKVSKEFHLRSFIGCPKQFQDVSFQVSGGFPVVSGGSEGVSGDFKGVGGGLQVSKEF